MVSITLAIQLDFCNPGTKMTVSQTHTFTDVPFSSVFDDFVQIVKLLFQELFCRMTNIFVPDYSLELFGLHFKL